MEAKQQADTAIANISIGCSALAVILTCWPGFDALSPGGFVILFFLVAVAITLAVISYWGKRSERGLLALLFAIGWLIAPVIFFVRWFS